MLVRHGILHAHLIIDTPPRQKGSPGFALKERLAILLFEFVDQRTRFLANRKHLGPFGPPNSLEQSVDGQPSGLVRTLHAGKIRRRLHVIASQKQIIDSVEHRTRTQVPRSWRMHEQRPTILRARWAKRDTLVQMSKYDVFIT